MYSVDGISSECKILGKIQVLDLNFPVAKHHVNLNKDRIQFRRVMRSLNQHDRRFFAFGRMQQGCHNKCGNHNLAKSEADLTKPKDNFLLTEDVTKH